MAQLKVRWKKSAIGFPRDQRETLRALGFRRLYQELVKEDNPSVRGMLAKISHLVDVTEV